jgi:predicted HTH domain antitoxin
MVNVEIPITESVLTALKMNEAEIAVFLRRESAFKLYQNGSLTLKQSADLCGVDLYDFMTMLSSANIPVIDYSPEELETEISSLEFSLQTAAQ